MWLKVSVCVLDTYNIGIFICCTATKQDELNERSIRICTHRMMNEKMENSNNNTNTTFTSIAANN